MYYYYSVHVSLKSMHLSVGLNIISSTYRTVTSVTSLDLLDCSLILAEVSSAAMKYHDQNAS